MHVVQETPREQQRTFTVLREAVRFCSLGVLWLNRHLRAGRMGHCGLVVSVCLFVCLFVALVPLLIVLGAEIRDTIRV